jgi:hypothetical protein
VLRPGEWTLVIETNGPVSVENLEESSQLALEAGFSEAERNGLSKSGSVLLLKPAE